MINYRNNIYKFHFNNIGAMRQLYGSVWPSDELAARMILSYSCHKQYIPALNSNSGTGRIMVMSFHSGLLAHTTRCIMIAKKLMRMDVRLIFIIDKQQRYANLLLENFQGTNLDIRNVPIYDGIDHLRKLHNNPTGSLFDAEQIEVEASGYLAKLIEINKQICIDTNGEKTSVDAVIADDTCINIAAEKLSLRLVILWNFATSNFHKRILPMPETDALTLFLKKCHLFPIINYLSRLPLLNSIARHTIYEAKLRKMAEPYNVVRKKLGVREVKNIFDQFAGGRSLVLLIDPVSTSGLRVGFNVNGEHTDVFPVGTINHQPNIAQMLSNTFGTQKIKLAEDLARAAAFLNPEKRSPLHGTPLFAFVMGSTGKRDLFDLAVQLFSQERFRGCRLFMATGGQVDSDSFMNTPSNIMAINYYPIGDVLNNNNIVATWTHGGTGSTHFSIDRGVPVICTPTHPDQEIGTDYVLREGLGAGVLYRSHKSQAQILKDLGYIIEDMLRQKKDLQNRG